MWQVAAVRYAKEGTIPKLKPRTQERLTRNGTLQLSKTCTFRLTETCPCVLHPLAHCTKSILGPAPCCRECDREIERERERERQREMLTHLEKRRSVLACPLLQPDDVMLSISPTAPRPKHTSVRPPPGYAAEREREREKGRQRQRIEKERERNSEREREISGRSSPTRRGVRCAERQKEREIRTIS